MAQKFNDIVKAFNQLIDSEYQWAVKERKDIYFDRWEYIIRDALAEIFTTDTAKGLRCLVTGEMNLLKRTVNTISSIYNEKATRRLVLGEDKEGELETDEVYEELIKSVSFDLIMKKANQMTNLTNACAIRTVWREGKIDYDIMTFDSLQIITDPMDWKKIIGYCFYIGSTAPYFQEVRETNGNSIQVLPHRSHPGEQSPYIKYQSAVLYTSNNDFFDKQYQGKVIYFDQTKGGEAVIQVKDGKPNVEDNPYILNGDVMLPFTFITKDYPIDFLVDYSSGNDLVWLTINTAVRYVHMNNLFTNTSWKQIYAISDVDLPATWNLDPRATLRLPQSKDGNTQIGLLDLQTNIREQWDVIVEMIKVGLAQYGIDAQSLLRSGGNPESGFSIQIRKEGLNEIRKAQIPLYAEAEKDLFEKTRVVYNYHASLEKKPLISEEGEFYVDFADPVKTSNQAEDDAHWQTLIRENVKAITDWIMAVNTDIKTEEEAQEVLKTNRAINNRLKTILTPVQQPNESTAV